MSDTWAEKKSDCKRKVTACTQKEWLLPVFLWSGWCLQKIATMTTYLSSSDYPFASKYTKMKHILRFESNLKWMKPTVQLLASNGGHVSIGISRATRITCGSEQLIQDNDLGFYIPFNNRYIIVSRSMPCLTFCVLSLLSVYLMRPFEYWKL